MKWPLWSDTFVPSFGEVGSPGFPASRSEEHAVDEDDLGFHGKVGFGATDDFECEDVTNAVLVKS